MQITVTDNAWKKIEQLVHAEHKPDALFRISIDGGGCSGFLYNYEISELRPDDDYIIENGGLKIAVDSLSQGLLEGSKVDFIEELGSSYFSITNPKATAKCGCGNSFAI